MYGKLFASMYEGTLYGQWETIVTLQQLVVLADEDGVVDMTPPAIAARTSIPLEIIEKGIECLERPDKYSRSPAEEGRRIVLIDDERPWGWRIVNYKHYRNLASREDKKQKDRERIREKRGKAAGYDGPLTGEDCSYCGAPATGVDHIIATSKGGANIEQNVTPACNRCNSSKRDRDLVDFLNDSTTEIDVDRVLKNQKLTRLVAFCRELSRFVANVAYTDTDTDKPHMSKPAGSDSCPQQKIVDLYHELCPSLPRVQKLTPARQQAIRARWRNDLPTLDDWSRFFAVVSESKFLTGQAPPTGGRSKPFLADIDFLTKQGNVVKIMEGKYDD
jgi:5-methylcytosine-specific restriction endonuclease McrA